MQYSSANCLFWAVAFILMPILLYKSYQMQNITLSYTKLWELFAASHEERLTFFKGLNKRDIDKKPEKHKMSITTEQEKALFILRDLAKADYITAKTFAANYWPNSANILKAAGSAGNILNPLVKLKCAETKYINGTVLFKISANGLSYLQ